MFWRNRTQKLIHVAFELGLNQSQYSRRENGVIKFNSDENSQLFEFLDVSPLELFNSESIQSQQAEATR